MKRFAFAFLLLSLSGLPVMAAEPDAPKTPSTACGPTMKVCQDAVDNLSKQNRQLRAALQAVRNQRINARTAQDDAEMTSAITAQDNAEELVDARKALADTKAAAAKPVTPAPAK